MFKKLNIDEYTSLCYFYRNILECFGNFYISLLFNINYYSSVFFPAPQTKSISWNWSFPTYSVVKEVVVPVKEVKEEEPSSTTEATTTTTTEAPSTPKPIVYEYKIVKEYKPQPPITFNIDTAAIAKSKQDFFNAASNAFWQKKNFKNNLVQQAFASKGSVNVQITKS